MGEGSAQTITAETLQRFPIMRLYKPRRMEREPGYGSTERLAPAGHPPPSLLPPSPAVAGCPAFPRERSATTRELPPARPGPGRDSPSDRGKCRRSHARMGFAGLAAPGPTIARRNTGWCRDGVHGHRQRQDRCRGGVELRHSADLTHPAHENGPNSRAMRPPRAAPRGRGARPDPTSTRSGWVRPGRPSGRRTESRSATLPALSTGPRRPCGDRGPRSSRGSMAVRGGA